MVNKYAAVCFCTDIYNNNNIFSNKKMKIHFLIFVVLFFILCGTCTMELHGAITS